MSVTNGSTSMSMRTSAVAVISMPTCVACSRLRSAGHATGIIAKAPDKSAQAVTDALLTVLQPHADLVHTLTYDNGKEFAYHQTVAEGLDAQGYFAHPYHSWERGLNENTNGLIRQYLPKGTDFRTLTLEKVRSIMDRLNNRPRKCLGFKTPNQLFSEINPPVALTS